MKAESYKPCQCGEDCSRLGAVDGEPCWGAVWNQDRLDLDDGADFIWIHLCEGHEDHKYSREAT